MRLGFQEDERVAVLMRATSSASRPMKINGWQWPGQKRPRRGGVFPAQAQVAAWARRRRARTWLGRAAGLSMLGWATAEAAGSWARGRAWEALTRAWAVGRLAILGRHRKSKSQFWFFLFPGKLKIQIGSKEK